MHLTTSESYIHGNRLRIPECLDTKHFAYQAIGPAVDDSTLGAVVEACLDRLSNFPLGPADIDSILPFDFSSEAGKACDLLTTSLGLTAQEKNTASIIACEWAAIHSDPTFAGKSFVMLVLHTGPNPYVMQVMSTGVREYRDEAYELVAHTTSLLLSKGDLVVFDPTSAHTAVPKFPASGQILLLLQFEIADDNEEQRAEILRRFPPKKDAITGFRVFDD
jgi:hypothetical protein